MLVNEGVCALEHMEVRGPLSGVGSLLPLWDPGIKLGSSDLWGKVLFIKSNHFTGHQPGLVGRLGYYFLYLDFMEDKIE